MKRWLLISFLIGSWSSEASLWRPNEKLLVAVRLVESSDGLYTYGDEGRSLGDFQLSEAAWLDVNTWRKSRGVQIYDYGRFVFNSRVSRLYATDYLTLIHSELSRKLRRPPNSGEIYAAYNMGLGMFGLCDYNLGRVNPVTARKCLQIRKFMRDTAH
jgi:hypothetical protein